MNLPNPSKVLDSTESQSDRRPYYCSWSRATAFYVGTAGGIVIAALIAMIDLSTAWRIGLGMGLVAFCLASALYYNNLGGGEPVTDKRG